MDSAERPEGASVEGAFPAAGQDLSVSQAEAETYRPFNMLSMIGFALAALFAAFIGIGSLASYFSRTALLLPAWIALWPLLALALSYLARVQIQTSEGTRSGAQLTSWAIGLCLIFGLSYWVYYLATGLAVQQQASEALERWFQLIEQGKNEDAFFMTLNPAANATLRANQSDLREVIETRFNSSPGESIAPGAYSFMQQMDYYRYIRQGGAETKTKFLRVEDWGLKDGHYRIRLRYLIETPELSFELSQVVEGLWPANSPRRVWYVNTYVQESYRAPDSNLTFTKTGKQILENWSDRPQTGARSFMQSWVQTLTRLELGNTFLGTLPSDQKTIYDQLKARNLLKGPGIAGLNPAEAEMKAKYTAFLAGALVQADEKVFFCDSKIRAEVIAEVKRGFSFESPAFEQIRSLPVQVPYWNVDEKTVSLGYDVMAIVLVAEPGKADMQAKKLRVVVEGRLFIEGSREQLEKEQPNPWHVARFELLRARTMGEGSSQPGRPKMPQMGG